MKKMLHLHQQLHRAAAQISEESKQVRERQEKALQDLLIKHRAAAFAVPTNDIPFRESP